MSTRASIIIQDQNQKLYFYRHSDGYPECTGADLAAFVEDYKTGAMRDNVGQSAGWLVVRGHFEYKTAKPAGVNDSGVELWPATPDATGPKPNPADRFSGWKVGAYEPTDGLHGDVEYIYIIDLDKRTLSCRRPKDGFWDNANLKNTVSGSNEFETVSFK